MSARDPARGASEGLGAPSVRVKLPARIVPRTLVPQLPRALFLNPARRPCPGVNAARLLCRIDEIIIPGPRGRKVCALAGPWRALVRRCRPPAGTGYR